MKNHSSIDQSVSSSDLAACTTLAVDLAKQVFQVALLIAPMAYKALADSWIDLDAALLNFLLMKYLHKLLYRLPIKGKIAAGKTQRQKNAPRQKFRA